MMFVQFYSYYDHETIFMQATTDQIKEIEADTQAYRIEFLLVTTLDYPRSVLIKCLDYTFLACYIDSDMRAFKEYLATKGVTENDIQRISRN